MIYFYNNIYYLKSGEKFEIANIEIKYSRIKKHNIIVVSGSGVYSTFSQEEQTQMQVYSFKELENKLVGGAK